MAELPVEIRKLCPELMQDFLRFFDGEAFADNPRWSFCYCQFLYVDHAKIDWSARTAQENRAAACDRIRSERMDGYIAYRAGEPVDFGPLRMYLAAGFHLHRTDADGRVHVRRSLV